MSESKTFDFVVIGGGSAGYAAARTSASLGLKTAVVDGSPELGGLCILRGCMPSKTLIESANRNLVIRHAGKFGLHARTAEPDIRSIRDRKRLLIEDFASYRRGQLQDGRFELVRGRALVTQMSDSGAELEVALAAGGSEHISARTLLLATGSDVTIPQLPGLQEAGYWTSDTILDAAELPASFTVLGGGAIALEMAHYLEGMGRKVTVIQRSQHLLSNMDHDIADVVKEAFIERGMSVHCGTSLLGVERRDGQKIVRFLQGENEHTASADEILVALGRRPAVRGLGLDGVGIEQHPNGAVVVTATQQTSQPRVFAAGDICGPLEVVHLAIQQGEIAARNAARLLKGEAATEKMDYRCRLFGVFTEPQVAAVGMSESEAKAQGLDFIVATYPFADHGKSMVMGELHGLVKLIADRSEGGRILGGAVVGPEATELIHEIALAMHLRATARDIATAPHYHPTLSEIWTYPAEELSEALPPSP